MGSCSLNCLNDTTMKSLLIFSTFLLVLAYANSTCKTKIPSWMTSSNRIIGGQKAKKPIPWQVSVRDCNNGNCHTCGGTILDNLTILTAAHCFKKGQSLSKISIMAGHKNRKAKKNNQIRKIANLIWNEEYPHNGNTDDNDVVIMKLTKPLKFNSKVKPACLPLDESWSPESDPNNRCYASGWGTRSNGSNKIPKKLYWVSLPVITNEKCNEGYKGEVLDSMLCAGFESGGKAGCSGDSGGPLICPNENNNPIITGVDSWGYKCGAAKYPGVYGRVTKFLSWIKENMEKRHNF